MSSTLASSKERDGIDSKYYTLYVSQSSPTSSLLSNCLMIRLFVADGRLTHRDAGDGYEPGYLGDDVILFKIQSTQSNRYRVRPVDGILSSKQKWIDIYIALRPVESVEQLIDDTKGRDKLLVRSIRLSQDEFFSNLNTSKNSYNGMENAKEIWKRYGERSEKTYIPIRFEVIERKNDPGMEILSLVLPENQNPNDMMNLLVKNWSKLPEDKLSSSELLQLKGLHDRCTPSQWEELQNISRDRLLSGAFYDISNKPTSNTEENLPVTIQSPQKPVLSLASSSSLTAAEEVESEELLKMPRLLITKAESDIERGQSNVAITKLKKSIHSLQDIEKPSIQVGKLELRAYSKLCDAIIMNDKNYSEALSALESALVLAIVFNDKDDLAYVLSKGKTIIQVYPMANQATSAKYFSDSLSDAERANRLGKKIEKITEKFKPMKPSPRKQLRPPVEQKPKTLSPIYPVVDKEDENLTRKSMEILSKPTIDDDMSTMTSPTKTIHAKVSPKVGIRLLGNSSKSVEKMNDQSVAHVPAAQKRITYDTDPEAKESKSVPSTKKLTAPPSQRRSNQFSQKDTAVKVAPPAGVDGYHLKTVLAGKPKYVFIAPSFEEACIMVVGDLRKRIAKEWGIEDDSSFDMLVLGVSLSNKWRGTDFGFRKTSFFEIRMKEEPLLAEIEFTDVNEVEEHKDNQKDEIRISAAQISQLDIVGDKQQDLPDRVLALEKENQEMTQKFLHEAEIIENEWKTKVAELEALVQKLRIEKDNEIEELRNKYQELENESNQRIAELEFELSTLKNEQGESDDHNVSIEELTKQLNEKNIELQRINSELETVKGENNHLTIALEVAKEKFRESLFPVGSEIGTETKTATASNKNGNYKKAKRNSIVINFPLSSSDIACEAFGVISPSWTLADDDTLVKENLVTAFENGNIVRVAQNGDGDESDKLYLLDHVFQRQDEVVYEIAIKLDDTIKNICLGKQGLILICGSEKSGKSRIVHGQSGYIGLIEKLFGHVHEMTMSAAIIITKITVSLQLLDQQNATTDLILKQEISSPKDFEAILNDHHEKFTSSSSLYHKVVTIIIEGQSVGEDELRTVGVLRIVDLIDSEALQQHHQKVEDVESSTAIMSSESLPASLTSLLNPSRDIINILIIMNPKDATGSILSLDLAKAITKSTFTEVE